jgi:hypothetical protein
MRVWILVAATAIGCGPSPVAVCAGNHSGSFDGSDVGTLSATLDEKGNASVTMDGEASGSLSSSGSVADDGTIDSSGIVSLTGSLDLESCNSSGTWQQGALGLSGTWSMSLQ